MALVLNEEQRLLAETAREFLQKEAPVSALRALRNARDPLGYDPELWRQMAELGWASVILPEDVGGLDFGFSGLGVVLQETGRTLAASPLFATAVVGASALLLGGSEAQKADYLPQVAAGELTLALALEESHHHRPHHIATRLERSGDGFLLSGEKLFVLDGHSADALLVVARSAGETSSRDGLSVVLVPRDTSGVEIERTIMADSRNAANIRFNAVSIASNQVIGTEGEAGRWLEDVLDRGRIAMAAEMLGSVEEVFARTVAWLKERVQFGVPIGSFQALQHRAASLQAELELARSVVLQALTVVDEQPQQLAIMASLAKATLNDLGRHATNEAVQMHGGIGVTDELEIGFFLKRARTAMQILGDTGFHKNRYATLCGY
ncbi:MAG: acyl-CoA dehydrogenase [Haliea sp.]|uniref:acyl-CoA dehydrogenase family protein n=1 Tax=Haliea sp. TaxID=1932666 RepID=UPI000C46BC3E|nr:acyl-CoA dehydrogenase [Haliea sp.]MBM69297.1 acyl-CoA dehydrogenase [Haliea sp.]|tara:strand:- start:50070 stop:51209 length:1140 start_codon:yes stop_codon:yes gene_type:complete